MINDFVQKSKGKGIFKSLAVACLVLNLNPSEVKADQPVHCLKDDIYGQWDFHVSNEQNNVNLFETREVCTHLRPNHVQIIGKDHQFKFENESVWKVHLGAGYQATAQQPGGGEVSGTWSTIYDQAMRIELDNGMRFVTNFRYNVKDSISTNPPADGESAFVGLKAGDYDSFDTDCSQTMAGFIQKEHGQGDLKQHNVQCFYGKQTKKEFVEKSIEESPGNDVKIAVIVKEGAEATPEAIEQAKADAGVEQKEKTEEKKVTKEIEEKTGEKVEKKAVDNKTKISSSLSQGQDAITAEEIANILGFGDDTNVQLNADVKIEAEKKKKKNPKKNHRKSHKRWNAHHAHKPSDETDLLIETINGMDIGWKADVCKLQKHHASYDAEKCEGTMLAQTKTQTTTFGQQKNFAKAHAKANMYSNMFNNADDIPDKDIPDEWDWRNIDGVDYTNKHRDQKACGSCYTVSFTQIVEQRLKKKYGKDIPWLSPQQLMTCNYMNEGCDGGWPFFHGFFGENGYLVTEECAPYQAKTKGDSCKNYASCEPYARISDSYFIGKGYGDATEKKMMKEIMRNGIVNGEIEAPHIFHTYRSGILTSSGIQELHQKLSLSNQLAQVSQSQSDKKPSSLKKKMKIPLTDRNLADYGISWQNLNHSVVILGWGSDPETARKYWIVRNSYGPDWGDHGDFLVQRGTDDFAIESETTAYEPVMCSEGGC